MKVKVGGPLAHKWADETIEAWTGATLDVDDTDAERVGYFRDLAAAGMAEIIEDAPKLTPAPVAEAETKSGILSPPAPKRAVTPPGGTP